MQATRESIEIALAAFLAETVGLDTVSRVYRQVGEYAREQLPAGLIESSKEVAEVPVHGLPATNFLYYEFWLYLPAPQLSQICGQETILPVTDLNNLLDAVEAALPNPESPIANYNTLGGLVQHVWKQGTTLKIAGTASGNMPVSVARVPILILAI